MMRNHGFSNSSLEAVTPQQAMGNRKIDNCWVYLNDHRGRTHYGKFRRGGYPLGSGGIESSNTFMCHVRLKRSGAWWYEATSNQMLALRCAMYNETLDQAFVRYQQRRRAMSE